MKVAIRADASPAVGSGHVVRCLALADGIAARGGEVCFVTRQLPEHLNASLASSGHRHVSFALAAPAGSEAPQDAWPVEQQFADAAQTRAALVGFAADWVVVDHYGLATQWETQIRPAAGRLLAIDDLARPHDCDLLLDANYHPDPSVRYRQAQDRGARLLLGPRHALLRPEFAQARTGVGVRKGPAQRLLVFLGGMDAGNATGRVLAAVDRLREPPELDVIIGAAHPARAEIQAFCEARAGRRCHVQTRDMASLLARADVAIGAGGGASWERCCLGVPSLALALAKNQTEVLAPAADAGLLLMPDGGLPEPELLAAHLRALLHNTALRQRMSAAGMAAVDGRGVGRVVAAMFGSLVQVRPAAPEDSDRLHAWRNAAAVRAVSRNGATIPLDEHRRWFDAVLRSPDRVLLVGEDAAGAVGVVRFDVEGPAAEVSIYLAEARLGQGLGPGLLHAAEEWLATHRPEVSELRAEVLAGNTASTLLFEGGGYERATERFSKRMPYA
jgi:UDP-2,4-diacetamido-2,4,6-trideoxy-beta-L-altropyranose hydrolase